MSPKALTAIRTLSSWSSRPTSMVILMGGVEKVQRLHFIIKALVAQQTCESLITTTKQINVNKTVGKNMSFRKITNSGSQAVHSTLILSLCPSMPHKFAVILNNKLAPSSYDRKMRRKNRNMQNPVTGMSHQILCRS